MNPPTATTSPRTSPTRRSGCCRTSSKPRRASRSSPGSRPVPCTRRTRSPTNGSRRTSGSSTTGWDAWRALLFERQVASGVVPAGTELTPRPPWVAEWDALAPEEQRLYARMMEVFAGFLSHTDHQIGRVIEHLRANDLLDDTLICLHVRQRDQRRGRTVRLGQRAPLRARSRRRPRGEPRPASTISAASVRTTTTRGVGRGPATRRCACGSATRGSAVCARR